MASPRLLLLSYAFPPMTAPEAVLSAKRVANLPGWEVEVIAAAPFHPGLGNDAEMAVWIEARLAAVHRLSPPFRLPFHRLGALAHLPDPMRLLNRRAVAKAAALHRSRPFDAVLSWSTYHSIHLAGLALKRRLGLPWLVHMSDPWVDNPFVRYGRLTRALNAAMEHSVLAAADRVLLTSPETVDLVMAKHPARWRDKTHVIPHGYDPALYPGERLPPPEGRALVARYLGNFYGVRSPEPLFAAIVEALRRDAGALDGVAIEIVGQLDPGMMQAGSARHLPPGLVRFRPPVGYRDSLGLMQTADLLLLVDAPANVSVFLPSKLVDYLGARRPVLALTSEGAARRVTREAGFWTAAPDDPVASATALTDAIAAVRRGQGPAGSGVERYSSVATGLELAEVLRLATGRAGRDRQATGPGPGAGRDERLDRQSSGARSI